MFKVRDSKWVVFIVYAVQSCGADIYFLIYDLDWTWINANDCFPIEEDDTKE